MADIGDTLQFVVDGCAPYDLPGAWARLTRPADFFHAPPESAALLAELRAQFSVDEISKSGVAVRSLLPSTHGISGVVTS